MGTEAVFALAEIPETSWNNPFAGVGEGDCYYEEESIQPQCLSSICFCLKDILNTNDKSEPIPHLEDSVRIIIDWSEWRDLNSRPLDPQSSALPTALHPDLFFMWLSQTTLLL